MIGNVPPFPSVLTRGCGYTPSHLETEATYFIKSSPTLPNQPAQIWYLLSMIESSLSLCSLEWVNNIDISSHSLPAISAPISFSSLLTFFYCKSNQLVSAQRADSFAVLLLCIYSLGHDIFRSWHQIWLFHIFVGRESKCMLCRNNHIWGLVVLMMRRGMIKGCINMWFVIN